MENRDLEGNADEEHVLLLQHHDWLIGPIEEIHGKDEGRISLAAAVRARGGMNFDLEGYRHCSQLADIVFARFTLFLLA